MSKLDWERQLIERIVERLEISHIRASDLFHSHYTDILREHANGSTPNQAATVLLSR